MDASQITVTLPNLPKIIAAVGGLGTAAMGIVDAGKVAGVNKIGFPSIRKLVSSLTDKIAPPAQTGIINTLRGNWYNGTDLASQKAIAKTLIKANLTPATAPSLAAATFVDPVVLAQVATNIQIQTPLTPLQSDTYGRFDFGLTALLDATYQRSDVSYRKWTRVLAGSIAILIALLGAKSVGITCLQGFLVGILAVPLAPVAKDLSSALAAAVNQLQLIKK
jgi:hypothetical protein